MYNMLHVMIRSFLILHCRSLWIPFLCV